MEQVRGGEERPGPARRGDAGRMLMFSDGVFAIAFTILVLDLEVPDDLTPAGLRAALAAQVPHIYSALLSFAVIGRFWIAHHTLFERIVRADGVLLVLNTVLLAPIALIPFGAGLLGEYGRDSIAVVVYAVVVAAAAGVQLVIWLWASHRRRLIGEDLDDLGVLGVSLGLAGALLAFVVSIPVALVSPGAAELCWLIAVVPADPLARWLVRRRPAG